MQVWKGQHSVGDVSLHVDVSDYTRFAVLLRNMKPAVEAAVDEAVHTWGSDLYGRARANISGSAYTRALGQRGSRTSRTFDTAKFKTGKRGRKTRTTATGRGYQVQRKRVKSMRADWFSTQVSRMGLNHGAMLSVRTGRGRGGWVRKSSRLTEEMQNDVFYMVGWNNGWGGKKEARPWFDQAYTDVGGEEGFFAMIDRIGGAAMEGQFNA